MERQVYKTPIRDSGMSQSSIQRLFNLYLKYQPGKKHKEIQEDLSNLKKLGVAVYSVTCDGHKTALKAVSSVYPNAIIQRCVVHDDRALVG